MKKIKTTLVLERRRLTVVRTKSSMIETYCKVCSKQVLMVSPALAAERASVPVNSIYRGIACNTLHFVETAAGQLLVCCDSLKSDLRS